MTRTISDKPLINSTILMSDASNFDTAQAINPYYHKNHANSIKANVEHRKIQEMLEKSGINIIQVPSPIGCQDGVYVANWALVRGNTAIIAKLPNARENEEPYAEKILSHLGKKVVHVPSGLKFSGQGDALPCGDLLFCGSGYRSDEAAQDFAAKTLGYRRVQLRTVPILNNGQPAINAASGWPDSYFYDIDLALAIIRPPMGENKGLIAYCREAFTPESQKILFEIKEVDKIIVSLDEAKNSFATNLVSTGRTVIMSNRALKLAKELRHRGLKILAPEINEISKGGGYIRCITLTIN